jgi:hypothetical protein
MDPLTAWTSHPRRPRADPIGDCCRMAAALFPWMTAGALEVPARTATLRGTLPIGNDVSCRG